MGRGRRANNEGSISERKDGRFEAKITLPDGDRKSFYGATREEAAQKLILAQHDLLKGLPVVPERQTVGQYLEIWLASMQMQVDASTWRRYADEVKRLRAGLGKIVLSRLTSQQLTLFYSECVTKHGLSPATVRHLHSVMHHALADALDDTLVQRNVAKQARKPALKTAEIQPLSEDDANAFLDYLVEMQHRMETLYTLALTTGMRQGELLALHWREIHLEQKKLQVRWSLQEQRTTEHNTFVIAEPKTEHSKRTIVLSETAVTSLRGHQLRQKVERLAAGNAWQKSDLVFPNEIGQMQMPIAIRDQFRALLKKAGLPAIRFHDLRHTCATILLSRGIPVKQVSEMLGHSDIAITLRVYGHVIPAMHEAAASMMDMVFARRA